MTYWAVPWFFTVSGYFLVPSLEKRTFVDFCKAKAHSLLIPFLLWSIWGYIVASLSASEFKDINICDIFACGNVLAPMYNTALWYVRSLMLFFLLYVVIHVFTKNVGVLRSHELFRIILNVIVFAFVCCIIMRYFKLCGPKTSPFYFCAGIVIMAFTKAGYCNYSTKRCIAIGACCLLASVVSRIVWLLQGWTFYNPGGTLINNLSVITFITSIVLLRAPFRADCPPRPLVKVVDTSAFIYFAHRPLTMAIINPLRETKLSVTELEIVFWLSLVLFPLSCLIVTRVFRWRFPAVYNILSGGR